MCLYSHIKIYTVHTHIYKSYYFGCNLIIVQHLYKLISKYVWSQVENAVSSGLTGIACTDEQRLWNMGTQRNLCPKRLKSVVLNKRRIMVCFRKCIIYYKLYKISCDLLISVCCFQ